MARLIWQAHGRYNRAQWMEKNRTWAHNYCWIFRTRERERVLRLTSKAYGSDVACEWQYMPLGERECMTLTKLTLFLVRFSSFFLLRVSSSFVLFLFPLIPLLNSPSLFLSPLSFLLPTSPLWPPGCMPASPSIPYWSAQIYH